MKFEPTQFDGVWLITLEPRGDERGYLMRTYCEPTFRAHGLTTHWPQCNETLTTRRGSIRGMHWQKAPHGEAKLVRCSQGRIWDVVVDVRQGASTFGQWQAFELDASRPQQLHIPPGFAHGFQTLSDHAVLHYQMGELYRPDGAAGCRWDDPALAIPWPLPVADLSARDAGLPLLAEAFDS
ncbi:MAG: dTDP-4-dehydrorhamnose 3,5-epimerase [Verrucomicrobiaceae bacterium]|nr:dTDP-4-dehydrorhamnose 3,5-epimerase [Verrucomicrobiaceae bacterium]